MTPAPLLTRLADLDARLRCLPGDNPDYASDALLIAAEWIETAATTHGHLERMGDPFARALRARAVRLRDLAPIFAPPAQESA